MLLASSTIIAKPINVGDTAIAVGLPKLMNTYNPFLVALYSVGDTPFTATLKDFAADRLLPGPLGVVQQQPGERLRWTIDYTSWLDASASIQSVTNVVAPTGDATSLTVTSSIGSGSRFVELLVSGGVVGTSYTVTVIVTTSDNQVREDELIVVVIA